MTTAPIPYVVLCDTRSHPNCRGSIGVPATRMDVAVELSRAEGWVSTKRTSTCPACLCAPTDGPIWAYYGQRAVTRKSTADEPLHAVSVWSKLGGALDAECGVIGAIEVGPWDPEGTHNCAKCAKFIAGQVPLPADAPPPALVVPEPVELLLPFPYVEAA